MQLPLLPTPLVQSTAAPLPGLMPPVARARRLPRLYYLQHFRDALRDVEQRYAGLLSGAELAFVQRFAVLPEPAQCLLVRLLMRKGAMFAVRTLAYPEVGDLHCGLQQLAALGWVDTDPHQTMPQLRQLLSRRDWRATFGYPVRQCATDGESLQLSLALDPRPSAPRPLSQWHRRLAGTHVRVTIRTIAERLRWLYFGNDHQSWEQFVMTDLGLQRYERVPYDAVSSAFRNREEIEHFYRLCDCRARLRDNEPPEQVLADATPPDVAGADWLRGRFARLQLRLGELLEKQGHVELALHAYGQSASAEACLRIMRMQQRMGHHAAARATGALALRSPASEGENHAIVRLVTRLRRRLGEPVAPAPPRRTFDSLRALIPPLADDERVERRVCALLSAQGKPAFYVENSLFPSLFGLLCWDAIFAPLPGAFFHPFQSGPADLHAPDFTLRRAHLFAAQLALLDSGEHAAAMWRIYRAKAGTMTSFIHWGRLTPPLLSLALQCIPPRDLKLIFQRLLQDLQNHCNGLPDLVHFTPGERRYCLVEVKAPGDRLQHNQRRWLEFFADHGIPAAVCRVDWGQAAPAMYAGAGGG